MEVMDDEREAKGRQGDGSGSLYDGSTKRRATHSVSLGSALQAVQSLVCALAASNRSDRHGLDRHVDGRGGRGGRKEGVRVEQKSEKEEERELTHQSLALAAVLLDVILLGAPGLLLPVFDHDR